MELNPQVYILLATYNRAHLVKETLVSIQNQTYTNFKCIVVDDKSSDTTKEVVQNFSEYDKRFIYKLKPEEYSKGLPDTRNYGLDIASKENAEFITFFDDDDIMHPNKLEIQMQLFAKSSQLDMVSCQYEGFITSEAIDYSSWSNEISVKSYKPAIDFLTKRIKIHSCGPIFRFQAIRELRFNKELNYYAEDEEYFLKVLFKKNLSYASVEKSLFYYRRHDNSVTASKENIIEKKGTLIRLDEIMWDFFEKNDILDLDIFNYYCKQFLLYNPNKNYLNKLEVALKAKGFYWRTIGLKVLKVIHRFYFKMLNKFYNLIFS